MQANERLAGSALLLLMVLTAVHSLAEVPKVVAPHQNPLWVDLSGPWQIIFEDRPEFAQPAYDDHAWQSISLPGELPGIRSSVRVIGWMRRHVELEPGTDCTQLALTLGVLTRSRYEVWFNGQRMPSSESLDPADARIPRPITHLIPPCTTPYPRSLLIAIHFVSLDMNPDWRLPDQGPYLLTNWVNATHRWMSAGAHSPRSATGSRLPRSSQSPSSLCWRLCAWWHGVPTGHEPNCSGLRW